MQQSTTTCRAQPRQVDGCDNNQYNLTPCQLIMNIQSFTSVFSEAFFGRGGCARANCHWSHDRLQVSFARATAGRPSYVYIDDDTCQPKWILQHDEIAFWDLRRNYYHWWRWLREVCFASSTAGRTSCVYTLVWLSLKRRFEWLSYYCYFVIVLEIWIWNVTLGLQIQIVGVDLVEMIGKRLIFNLNTTTNR